MSSVNPISNSDLQITDNKDIQCRDSVVNLRESFSKKRIKKPLQSKTSRLAELSVKEADRSKIDKLTKLGRKQANIKDTSIDLSLLNKLPSLKRECFLDFTQEFEKEEVKIEPIDHYSFTQQKIDEKLYEFVEKCIAEREEQILIYAGDPPQGRSFSDWDDEASSRLRECDAKAIKFLGKNCHLYFRALMQKWPNKMMKFEGSQEDRDKAWADSLSFLNNLTSDDMTYFTYHLVSIEMERLREELQVELSGVSEAWESTFVMRNQLQGIHEQIQFLRNYSMKIGESTQKAPHSKSVYQSKNNSKQEVLGSISKLSAQAEKLKLEIEDKMRESIDRLMKKFSPWREDTFCNRLLAEASFKVCGKFREELFLHLSPYLAHHEVDQKPFCLDKKDPEANGLIGVFPDPNIGIMRAHRSVFKILNVFLEALNSSSHNKVNSFFKGMVLAMRNDNDQESPGLLRSLAPSLFISFFALRLFNPITISYRNMALNQRESSSVNVFKSFAKEKGLDLKAQKENFLNTLSFVRKSSLDATPRGVGYLTGLSSILEKESSFFFNLSKNPKDRTLFSERIQDMQSIYELLVALASPGVLSYDTTHEQLLSSCVPSFAKNTYSEEFQTVVSTYFGDFREYISNLSVCNL